MGVSGAATIPGSTGNSLQPPVTFFQKVSITDAAYPGGVVGYSITFTLNGSAEDVVVEDVALNGQSIIAQSGSVPTTITRHDAIPGRDTIDISFDDLGPGTYILNLTALVDANHKAGPGQYVKNSATLFTAAGWAATSVVVVPVVPAP